MLPPSRWPCFIPFHAPESRRKGWGPVGEEGFESAKREARHGRSSYFEDLHPAALAYHRLPRPGKLEIQASKPLANQRDLALAYSPGVAAACTEIAKNPAEAASPER